PVARTFSRRSCFGGIAGDNTRYISAQRFYREVVTISQDPRSGAREGHVMATVRDILARKGSHVVTVCKEATVLEAARLMNEHKIGWLVVVEDGCVVGMFTERDVLRRVVGEERDAAHTLVGELMTTEVACCTLQTTIAEARGAMKNRRIRHLPLVDDDLRL